MNLFDKLLYGLKVINENILVINEKLDNLAGSMNLESDNSDDIHIESIHHE